MKHVYLCGPVSGRPLKEVAPHFYMVEEEIRRKARANYDGVYICTSNPMRFCPPDFGWHEAMRDCVGEMVRCGGIALLQGWQASRGAALELKLAQELRIPVVYVEPPIDSAHLTELFTAAPETARYYNARLLRFQQEGATESTAESRAAAELSNRYLDPHGFEYIGIEQEE
jgi:hypothetical protein